MKNLFLISLINILIFSFYCCDSSESIIEITVKDGNSWSSNPDLDFASDAIVSLYKSRSDVIANNLPDYKDVTDATGKVRIKVNYQDKYYFIVQKVNAKNVIDGLLIYKIFESQSEINISPNQTPAPTPGSPMFIDWNQDAIVDAQDRIYADSILVNENHVATKTSIIYY